MTAELTLPPGWGEPKYSMGELGPLLSHGTVGSDGSRCVTLTAPSLEVLGSLCDFVIECLLPYYNVTGPVVQEPQWLVTLHGPGGEALETVAPTWSFTLLFRPRPGFEKGPPKK